MKPLQAGPKRSKFYMEQRGRNARLGDISIRRSVHDRTESSRPHPLPWSRGRS